MIRDNKSLMINKQRSKTDNLLHNQRTALFVNFQNNMYKKHLKHCSLYESWLAQSSIRFLWCLLMSVNFDISVPPEIIEPNFTNIFIELTSAKLSFLSLLGTDPETCVNLIFQSIYSVFVYIFRSSKKTIGNKRLLQYCGHVLDSIRTICWMSTNLSNCRIICCIHSSRKSEFNSLDINRKSRINYVINTRRRLIFRTKL